MALLKEYESLKEIRLKEGEISNAHYKSVDLPGTRTITTEGSAADAAKERIKKMKTEKEKPNNW